MRAVSYFSQKTALAFPFIHFISIWLNETIWMKWTTIWENVLTSNEYQQHTRVCQQITSLSHFRWTQTVAIFMLCFYICFIHGYKIAHISSHSLIRYWMSNMASDAKACFSSKVEYRAVNGYLYLKGKTGKEIHGKLADVYGSSAPSYVQVKFWVGEFKHGGTSLEDEARSGCPLDATNEEMCKKVQDLVYSDRQIQVKEIAQALGISHGSGSTILHDQANSLLGPQIL